jgi:dihydrofolate synthase/folylpolyglutamate synthase
LTFFEVLTLAALLEFETREVEVAVIEAGLGARLDASRIVSRLAVGFTRIGLDHQRFLGETISAIAAEKAHALDPGMCGFTVPQVATARRVLRERALATGAPLEEVGPLSEAPLPGLHQRENAALALALAKVIDPDTTLGDLHGVTWPGRLESLPFAGGTVVLDVAHNLDGIQAFVRHVAGASGVPGPVVVGCLADKPAGKILEHLSRLGRELWWVPPPGEDAAPASVAVPATGQQFSGVASERFRRALVRALGDGHTVWVCGSHVLVGALRRWMLGLEGAADPGEYR